MNTVRRTTPELEALVTLFYKSPIELGDFQQVAAPDLPPLYRVLLDHDQHMTITIEAHHGTAVNVHVRQTHITETHYARQILLSRRSDGEIVQYGIARLNFQFLGESVRRKIEEQQIPLGRILIEHNVLRTVRPLSLWKILPGRQLCRDFKIEPSVACFGRTALIYCNSVPAVELLEVVRAIDR